MPERLGNAPIEAKYCGQMNVIARPYSFADRQALDAELARIVAWARERLTVMQSNTDWTGPVSYRMAFEQMVSHLEERRRQIREELA